MPSRHVAVVDVGLAAADVAERIGDLRVQEGSLGELAAWEAGAAARAADREHLVQRSRAGRAKASELGAEKASLPALRAAHEAARSTAQRLAGSLPAAAREEQRLTVLAGKADELTRRSAELAGLDGDLAAADADGSALAAVASAAHDAWLGLITRQLADQSAVLASTLVSGDACPVCGSLEHPQPAHPSTRAALVTDAQVAAAKEEADAAAAAASGAADRVTTARAARDDLRPRGDQPRRRTRRHVARRAGHRPRARPAGAPGGRRRGRVTGRHR